MFLFYSILIYWIQPLLKIVALFNKKVANWLVVRKNWQDEILSTLEKDASYIWIHCASAGEFEQAIPLILEFKKQTSYKIAVSFFSSSGFTLYRNSELIDISFYFPLDTTKNVKELLSILHPKKVLFIRNEIWINTLLTLREERIPVYLVNANLNQKHHFIYQSFLNKSYPIFTKIYDTKAFGNTKLERVLAIKKQEFKDAFLEKFCKNNTIIILGSSWHTEEKFIAKFYKKHKNNFPKLKIIIAPHEFNSSKKKELENLFDTDFSSYTMPDKMDNALLFLDKKGMLKYCYRYATIAFIGGGFDKSVHNISEAAVYGIPTIFGTKYHKFEEVEELIELKNAFAINNYDEFERILLYLLNNPSNNLQFEKKSELYFKKQEKVSERIVLDIIH